MDTLKAWEAFEHYGFFALMRQRLKTHESKHSNDEKFEDLSLDQLKSHLRTEMDELAEALTHPWYSPVLQEAADVANMCAFVASEILRLNQERENIEKYR